MKQGYQRPIFVWKSAGRANRLIGGLLGIILTLTGCAEALQTNRPTAIRPSPTLPDSPMTADDLPLVSGETTPETETVSQATATSSPDLVISPPTTEPLTATIAASGAPFPVEDAPTDVGIVLPTPLTLSHEQRWRAQQENREAFETMQRYTTAGSQLWWYDPVNQQHVILGNFSGEFEAQARFRLVGQGVEALEVPYQINARYGLTALSPALIDRLRAAGYNDWVETYVILSPDVTQAP